jgi:hypothetical protein
MPGPGRFHGQGRRADGHEISANNGASIMSHDSSQYLIDHILTSVANLPAHRAAHELREYIRDEYWQARLNGAAWRKLIEAYDAAKRAADVNASDL